MEIKNVLNRKIIQNKKIVFIVNVDWFFLSHRLPIALAAKERGAEVFVITANTGCTKEIESYGFKVIDFPFSRRGTNYFRELVTLPLLLWRYLQIKPTLVHHITIKPVIYGSLVAKFFKKLSVVNAITGMGFAFSEDDKASGIQNIVKRAYRIALNNKNVRVIFQNEQDRLVFVENDLVKHNQTCLIRGSGVDVKHFRSAEDEKDSDEVIVLLAARMIWDKGIQEFVDAAKIVKKTIPNVRFLLAGKADSGNPNVVPIKILKKWEENGIIEWLGHCDNMVELIQSSTIVTLPTFYPEGVPKILIESASIGKPIITTNRPGCNDIVRDGVNGTLIPEKNSEALAVAIIQLLENPDKMKEFGRNGREIVINEFSEDIVVEETLRLYDDLLGDTWRKNKSELNE